MKLCLLGEYSAELDEGMRKVSFYFAEELSKYHQVLALDLGDVFTNSFWSDIKNFNPEIIHYIHGPSIKSFILLKLISLYCRNAKTVMSAMRPCITYLSEGFIPLLKPDLVLVQSSETENMFKRIGCTTEFLPCGVDTEKFTPSTTKDKEQLRQKYGIDKNKFVILHIGSVKEGRNVQLLEKLQKENNQVVIVGAMSTGINKIIAQQLEKSGCFVWTKYFKDVEEIYAMADCYIFPTVYKKNTLGRVIADSVEMPLSVLEAMSCNLPVITAKFGALPRVFEDGDGLFFVEEESDFINALKEIKNGTNIKTRKKVLLYTWENIEKRLEGVYFWLLDGENE